MKRSDHYAGNQVRLFLGELKNGTHPSKVKAVQHFQNYIKTYKPNISDDNVDFLYTGRIDESETDGLLSWCGVSSEKHSGQLKRICGPLITFLRWLVTYEDDTIFYERFVRLSIDELGKVGFCKHILRSNDGKLSLSIPVLEHRNLEGEPDPIDVGYLLEGSKAAQDRFEEWLQKSNLEHINQTLNALKSSATTSSQLAVKRPNTWEGVAFKCIPLQEGEEVGAADVDEEPDEPPPVIDPMSLEERDLRVIQDLYSSGRLAKSALQKRATIVRLSADAFTVSHVRSGSLKPKGPAEHEELVDDDDDDDDDSPLSAATMPQNREKRVVPSVLPGDKSFSAPLFLSLVHGTRTFEELQRGLVQLDEYQRQQSSRRENLVRQHFGLFVQCADGLEWLKLYRKGIFKKNELPKSKAYRRSSLDERMSSAKGQLTVDQGMQKLRTAQQTLEIAKVEAKSTLAPILERMKQAREIRSAEKVLKSMAVLLEYPHSMRLALDRGELRDVVTIYQRVQAIPSSSALKIVQKVKAAADGVVGDLKRLCFSSLLGFNGNFSSIAKHAQLLQSLDGGAACLEVLRQSFVRHLLGFWEVLHRAKDKFCVDIADAHDRGQEYNLMTKNNLLNAADRESLGSVIRKYGGGTPRRERERGQLQKRLSSSSMLGLSTRRSFSKGSFSFGGSGSGALSFDDDLEPELVDDLDDSNGSTGAGAFVDDDGASVIIDSPTLGRLERSLSVDRGLGGEDDALDWLPDGATATDFCDLLSSVVRKAFAQNLLDAATTWFPLLYKLVYEIAQQQLLAKVTPASPAPMLAQLGKAASVAALGKAGRLGASANRLLAASLSVVTDFVQQMVTGVGAALKAPALPVELLAAVGEFDQYVASINAAYGLKLPPSNFDADFSNRAVSAALLGEVFAAPQLQAQLRPADHHEVLSECFLLFEGLEGAMTAAMTALAKQAETGDKKPAVPRAAQFDGVAQSALSSALAELDFSAPVSPYFDAMQTLSLLARQEEVFQTQKVLSRLVDKSFALGDLFLSDSHPDSAEGLEEHASALGLKLSAKGAAASTSAASGTDKTKLQLVEAAVSELEELLVKGLDVLKARVKRPDWVASLAFEALFQKVFLSFLEKLRRKMMLIEESRAHSDLDAAFLSAGVSPSTKRSRKKTHAGPSSNGGGVNPRGSMHQNQLILQALEDDLRSLELGWSREPRSGDALARTGKSLAWMDFVRALVRLRSFSLPKIIALTLKVFPSLSDATTSSSGAQKKSAAAGLGVAGSLLNRLFAFEAVALEPLVIASLPNKDRASPTDGADGGSLYTRVLGGLEYSVKKLQDHHSAPSLPAVLKALPSFADMAQLESDAVTRYLDYRLAGMRALLRSSYTLLTQPVAGGVGGDGMDLPCHVSRLILALSEEKRALAEAFGEVTVERGGGGEYRSTALELHCPSAASGEGKPDEERDDRMIIQTHRPTSLNRSPRMAAGMGVGSTRNQPYAEHLYRALCEGLLRQYEDLMGLLAQDVAAARALHQCHEEWAFFKTVLQAAVSMEELGTRRSPVDAAQLRDKSAVSREALLTMGQLMALLL